MTNDPVPMFRIDVSADGGTDTNSASEPETVVTLLKQLVAGQARHSQVLEEMTQSIGAAQKQRAVELGQWKDANPALARGCRIAAETLSRVQTQFLENLTEDITDNEDTLMDGEFMLNEFVDRYGPRLAHLNGVLQVLSQLSSIPQTPSNSAP